MPIVAETKLNRSYAFVNFMDSSCACQFRDRFHGIPLPAAHASQPVAVSAAALQGFRANYVHYSMARAALLEYSARPLFLRQPSPSELALMDLKPSSRGRRRRGGGEVIHAQAGLRLLY